MPATDQCEPQVIRAFDKAGWDVTDQPYSLRLDVGRNNFIHADLRLKNRQNGQLIIVICGK